MTLIRGLPGSGKSTLAEEITSATDDFAVHLEADMYHINHNGIYCFDAESVRASHKWCQEETEFNLMLGYHVVVSNTFTTLKELRPYFEIARKFDIVPSIILCQNNYGDIHNVPGETFRKMKERFQFDISSLFEVKNESKSV